MSPPDLRLDKWLWHARFARTRDKAAELIAGRRVRVNGQLATKTHQKLRPGDVAWAGVGCVHSFRNLGDGPLRWLETQSPQPPGRHSYRFARDWDYLRGGSS